MNIIRVRKYIYDNFFVLSLVVISLLLCSLNYQPGTWLSGWDTLHPEFDFQLYFSRIFSGVWQEHQGLGALATQSHIAEIPRMLIYYPLSFFLPLSFLRYSYFFLTLTLGPLGVYFFLKRVIFIKDHSRFSEIASFSGGLFYLLNLGTMQQYNVPLEMFATHFASLGWLFLFITQYIKIGNNKNLLIYALLSLASAPMAHTGTLWYVFFLTLTMYLAIFSILHKKKAIHIRSFKLMITTLLVNAFWLIPNVYFIFTTANTVQNSKIHELFSDEAFYQNAAFGTLPDLMIFRDFLFNWGKYVKNNEFGPLLGEWIVHLQNPFVLFLGYLFFAIVILGIVYSIKKNYKISLSLLGIFLLSAFFWININPPFGSLFIFLQNNIPLFKEALRFPFTKFSILFTFVSSIFFAYGIILLINLSKRTKKLNFLPFLIFLVVASSHIYYMLPAFKGNFINQSMKVNIPNQYFELFDWFKNQPNGRIASLPINSFWGWTYYDWGYQGAGFIWFGLKQPILDREFDRWSTYNEQYYREMSQAIYSQNPKLLKQVIEKYDISYILLDKSVIAPGIGANSKVLFYPEIEKMLIEEMSLKKAAQFGKNLFVYKVNNQSNIAKLETSSFTYKIADPVKIQTESIISYKDYSYEEYKNYIDSSSDNKQGNSINYPFNSLIDNQNRLRNDSFKVTQEGITISLPKNSEKEKLINSQYLSDEKSIPANILVSKNSGTLNITIYPKLPVNDYLNNSTPILISAPYIKPLSTGTILNINNSYGFSLDGLEENTPTLLGTVQLNTKIDNEVSLFSNSVETQIVPDFSEIEYFLSPCDETNGKEIFGLNYINKNGFSIFGKNVSLCMDIPLEKVIPNLEKGSKNILLGASIKFSGDFAPHVCLGKLNKSFCMESILKDDISTQLINKNTRNFYFSIDGSELNKQIFKISVDTTDNAALKKVFYENFYFSIQKPAYSTTIPAALLNESLKPTNSIDRSVSSVTIPYSGLKKLSPDITSVPKKGRSCSSNPLSLQITTEKNIINQKDQPYLHYFSQGGSFCDHFSYESLAHDKSYLIGITSRNVKGLPLRLCVSNSYSKRCDLYTELGKNKDFTQEFFLLPEIDNKDFGYVLNFNNFGVPRISSINDLSSIVILPFPYSWLSKIKSTNDNSVSKTTNDSLRYQNNNKVSLDSNQISKSAYVITEDISTFSNNTIVLSQSYNSGWKAYTITNNNWFKTAFPFIFGSEIKDHVMVNNWENGWVLNSQKLTANGQQLVIVYLPQYLQYLGFMALAVTLVVIASLAFGFDKRRSI